MSVCVVKNSADDYFQKAKQALEKQDFVQAFRMFRNALAFENITREKRIEIKKEYAKVLAMRGVFVASNQLLFEVLWIKYRQCIVLMVYFVLKMK